MPRTVRMSRKSKTERLPEVLPTRRGEEARVSYDESRKWLWLHISTGNRDVCNALYFWFKPARPRGVKRLPADKLDHLAIQCAAAWVCANPARVAYYVELRKLACK